MMPSALTHVYNKSKMSRTQDSPKSFLSFGNPFRMILPKGSSLSPELLDLLNTFEESLARRLKKLKPVNKEDVLRLSWMTSVMESLCGIHNDIKTLITSLELPISDWDDKWIDVYLNDSVKLLDICIAFSSEISRLRQGHLFLQCVLHNLSTPTSNQFVRACSSIDGWKHHISSNNPRFGNCFSAMDSLTRALDLPKIKNSSKGKALMRAMYGVKLVTLYTCSVFAAGFSGSVKNLMDFQVPETCLWAEAFTDLQAFVNTEIRSIYSRGRVTALKEVEAVDIGVKKLYPVVRDGTNIEMKLLQSLTSNLEKNVPELSQGLDSLAKEVDCFFQIVLSGRDALLCNLRVGGNTSDQMLPGNNLGQVVR